MQSLARVIHTIHLLFLYPLRCPADDDDSDAVGGDDDDDEEVTQMRAKAFWGPEWWSISY